MISKLDVTLSSSLPRFCEAFKVLQLSRGIRGLHLLFGDRTTLEIDTLNLYIYIYLMPLLVLFTFVMASPALLQLALLSNRLLFVCWLEQSCSERFDRSQKFNDIAREVVNEIAKEAPNYRGYALKHNTSLQGSSIYAMANCWKTMDRGMCSTCLADAAMVALSCLPSIESRVMNAGCFLRYSNYDFTNSPGKGNAIGQFLTILPPFRHCIWVEMIHSPGGQDHY